MQIYKGDAVYLFRCVQTNKRRW